MNQRFADVHFPQANAVGQRIQLSERSAGTVPERWRPSSASFRRFGNGHPTKVTRLCTSRLGRNPPECGGARSFVWRKAIRRVSAPAVREAVRQPRRQPPALSNQLVRTGAEGLELERPRVGVRHRDHDLHDRADARARRPIRRHGPERDPAHAGDRTSHCRGRRFDCGFFGSCFGACCAADGRARLRCVPDLRARQAVPGPVFARRRCRRWPRSSSSLLASR